MAINNRILSAYDIGYISNMVNKYSNNVGDAIKYISTNVNEFLSLPIVESYEQSDRINEQAVRNLKIVVEQLGKYSSVANGMADQTKTFLDNQKRIIEQGYVANHSSKNEYIM